MRSKIRIWNDEFFEANTKVVQRRNVHGKTPLDDEEKLVHPYHLVNYLCTPPENLLFELI